MVPFVVSALKSGAISFNLNDMVFVLNLKKYLHKKYTMTGRVFPVTNVTVLCKWKGKLIIFALSRIASLSL
jgi:hypothetical protein